MCKTFTTVYGSVLPTSQKVTKTRNNIAGVHYCVDHNDKMHGVISLSTDINSNPYCQARRRQNTAVCSVCFSDRLWNDEKGQYRNNNNCYKVNTEILTTRILSANELPYIDPAKWEIFRFEAFADIQNKIQVLNYFHIAKFNPAIRFALWTKNPGFVAQAIKVEEKPDNLEVVFSSTKINTPFQAEIIAKHFPFVSKIFTVYNDSGIQENNITINCGARSCLGCQRCYKKNPDGVIIQNINERVK